MDSEDIRNKYDLVRQTRSVSWILNMRPPPVLDGLPATEGLDCLIVVLRRIYSLAMITDDCLANLNGFKRSENENPILAFSWLMLGEPDGAEACARAVSTKRALIEAIPESTESFANLWKSARMNQTLWQKKLFHLYGYRYVLPSRPTDFVSQSEWNREEIADASIIQLNRIQQPRRTLQQAVDSCFGMDDGNTFYTSYRPRVIRVLYTPGIDYRLPFHALREFFLPRGEISTVNGRVRYQNAPRVRYALIAVVRMRSNPQDSDNVRTYEICGANITPECETASYTAGSWHIEEPSLHNFALFFCLAECELPIPDYPELAKASAMVDLETELAIEEDISRGLERVDLEASTEWAPRLKAAGTQSGDGQKGSIDNSSPQAPQTRGARNSGRRRSQSPRQVNQSPRRRARSHRRRGE